MHPATTAILYDADCGFCRWSVVRLLAWDRADALRPVAIQSDEGQALLADVPEDERLRSAHAVGPDGRVHSGGDAVPVVAAVLPGGAPIAWIAGRLPAPMRLAYRAVATNRVRLGRLVSTGQRARADAVLARRTRG
jgi:predicted DCC family thiol-disulfide oxidoreductase YuxK